MDKSQRIYVKALKKYNHGYIDKALELCEESISLNINNAASINLKGLIMYLKGDINACQKLWKMNSEINKDRVSEKYLESSSRDLERLKFYRESIILIKNMKINKAIDLLTKCSESDFNIININNHLAICHIKKGNYSKTINYLDKVLEIDINNKMAQNSISTINNINVTKGKFNTKKIVCIFLMIVFIISISSLSYFKLKNKNINTSNIKISKFETNNKNKQDLKNNTYKNQDIDFKYDTLKNYIDNENYNAIYDIVEKFKDAKLSTNDKVLLSKAQELLVSKGVEYFYKTGCDYLNNKNYKDAEVYFLRASKYGPNTYVYPDVIYMLANTFESSGNIEEAIKYYKQYDNSYSDGDYEETVLYKLSLIYNDLDKQKSKTYAQELIDKYPSSIYNNSVINSIVNN
ncbi:tetratricopeptide repeat protein [Clostridium tyrobutyricum]|uniref:tetratricopeptide repeat protein n=1 Tax=Clostridium tyrobutyricum TaxID=1519 RepID=UPI001C3813D1|nr:tetratricopeptide repeat protein [Clostridium tyrobutyricum]MBV4419018.1 tetratricopeptide repeat protein [Clostridium tyrobutyricum]